MEKKETLYLIITNLTMTENDSVWLREFLNPQLPLKLNLISFNSINGFAQHKITR